MSCSKCFAWVTHALSKDDVEGALVFAKPLRVTGTKASVVVVVDLNVLGKLRNAFETVFDLVLPIPDDWGELKRGIQHSVLALICSFALTCFEKCILLPPSSLVIQNPDEIFEKIYSTWENVEFKVLNTNPVMLKPSAESFKVLKDAVGHETEGSAGLKMMGGENQSLKCFKEMSKLCSYLEKECALIETQAFDKISLESNNACDFFNKKIIILGGLDKYKLLGKKALNEKTGEFEKGVYNMWTTFLKMATTEDMKPLEDRTVVHLQKIAVVGMAFRLPLCNNEEELWELLVKKKNAVRGPPPHRWRKEDYSCIAEGAEGMEAGFLEHRIDEFDAKFFEISPKEAVAMDPQSRVLMEVVWESFEKAGINPQGTKGARGGVFIGSWLNNYKQLVLQDKSINDFYRVYKGNCVGACAANISHFLGWTGPCVGIESDCSAGLGSVHNACRSLKTGEVDIALAGGVNLLDPFNFEILSGFISKDFRCKTFDESADGFARSEGCGVFILKRYVDAVKDKNNILGVIRGSAMNTEGLSLSMATPTVKGQVEVMQEALKNAGVVPSQVGYLEAHGTGTRVGDPVEMEAIGEVYNKGRTGSLIIGSVKTNLGHTESCSGIAGLAKVIVCLQNERIPAHLNLNKLNLKIDLGKINGKIPLEEIPWERSGHPRIAGISSFGVAGNNCHLIFEEHKKVLEKTGLGFERPIHIMKITAKSKPGLDTLVKKYIEMLKSERFNFSDIAHSANISRAEFNFRTVLIADSNRTGLEILESNLEINEVTKDNISICFLFTGQGSQYHGMAKGLYETSPVFKFHFDFCNDWVERRFGISVENFYFKGDGDENSVYSQIGIFIVEYSLMKLWLSWGITPSFVLGHSLGEFCAGVCAGILKIEDALSLVAGRSLLINNLPPGQMLVVKGGKEEVENLQREFGSNLDYAGFNSPEQTVVTGGVEEVREFLNFLREKQVKSTVLKSTHAFHSKDMDLISNEYKKILDRVDFNEVEGIKFISGVKGKTVEQVDCWYWLRHNREPVNFIEASRNALEVCNVFIEIGPQPVLSALVGLNKEIWGKHGENFLLLPSLRRNTGDWKSLFNSLGKLFTHGGKIDWKGVEEGYERKVCYFLPTYPFEKSRFWPNIRKKEEKVANHPLVGVRLENPSTTLFFQKKINVSGELEYLKDHVVGEMNLFPAAGFIEMMLAAGTQGFYGGSNFRNHSFQLKNLKISTPLNLQGGGNTCQALLETRQKESEGFECGVYQKQGGSWNEWVKHASAQFLPHGNYQDGVDEGLKKLLEPLTKSHNLAVVECLKGKNKVEGFYGRYANAGIVFGESFRTNHTIWICKETKELLAKVTVPKGTEKYLVHPTVIDGMIQAASFFCFDENSLKPGLMMPVGCKRFILVNPLRTQECFVYSPENSSAVLFTQDGTLLAVIYKIELVKTTLENVRMLVSRNEKKLPDFYKVEYLKTKDLTRVSNERMESCTRIFERRGSVFDNRFAPSEVEARNWKVVNKLASLYIIKCLKGLGWEPELNGRIEPAQLFCRLGIAKKHEKLFNRFLTFLEEDGFIEKNVLGWKSWCGEYFLKNGKVFNSVTELEKEIESLVGRHCGRRESFSQEEIPILLLNSIGQGLNKFLTNEEESVLRILFPKDTSLPSASRYYDGLAPNGRKFLEGCLIEYFNGVKVAHQTDGVPTMRILEVGAGTGFITGCFLNTLKRTGIPFEYVYTDISTTFFQQAKIKFKEFENSMKFCKLDLERDPMGQGFPPKYFDFVVAFHVLHATENIEKSLENVKKVVVDGGSFWFSEIVGSNRFMDCTFGLLEGYWRFKDFRIDHCSLSEAEWRKVCNTVGFSQIHCVKDEHDTFGLFVSQAESFEGAKDRGNISRWLLFSDVVDKEMETGLYSCFKQFERELVFAKGSFRGSDLVLESDQFEMSDEGFKFLEKSKNFEGIVVTCGLTGLNPGNDFVKSYLNLLKTIINLAKTGKKQVVYLITREQFGSVPCHNPFPAVLIGMTMAALNEQKGLLVRMIDLGEKEIPLWNIFHEFFKGFDGRECLIKTFQEGGEWRPVLTPARIDSSGLALPENSNRLELELPSSRLIKDLKFKHLESYELNDDEVEIRVNHVGLNFKDVLNVIKPTEVFERFNQVGVDFIGVVSRVGRSVRKLKLGDEVFGANPNPQPLASYVKTTEGLVGLVPTNFTFAEAVCFPVVFATAYEALVNIGRAQPGQTVLIHTASGGLGLVGIQIARKLNLEIFCTAGTPRKRRYLSSLGIANVFSSRDLSYSKGILQVTNEKGVDIVLNTITGPGFKEATLAATAQGGRFIELSLMNIWTESEVKRRRPDVKYFMGQLLSTRISRNTQHPNHPKYSAPESPEILSTRISRTTQHPNHPKYSAPESFDF